MWLDGIPHPTPAKGTEELESREEAKEEARKPRALVMGKGTEKKKCDAMGEKCKWSDLAVDTACVVCKKSLHRMCGEKFDDGMELEDEVRFKCDKCSAVNPL